MLELREIKKDYDAGENQVHALKGISLSFRKNEFVSILGPSGCGKTTMLNIIGGLDQYTSGDLIIDGVSTKDYKARDWDAYRNYSIGFVFQSYNLIQHQTVLQNVELALTLSGVKKKERRERAKQALMQVGLGDQLKKKPSEMSGGQMQRVAIARALVNNPEIILADEPTGALDSETSIQVMEILKEVAKDRLVIMVTHNPELAERYSTRIIRMLDGEIKDDSMPLTAEEIQKLQDAKQETQRGKRPSMSWGTSFGLSLKNLITKKGRTMLTIFAGSIGIIGIALIYAVSNGTTAYIDQVQQDTLSAYPLTLERSSVDVTTVMQTFMGVTPKDKEEHGLDGVYSNTSLFGMADAMSHLDTTENDLKEFKAGLEKELSSGSNEKLEQALTAISYSYDLDLLVYTKDTDGNIIRSDTTEVFMDAMKENMGVDMTSMMSLYNNNPTGMSKNTMNSMATMSPMGKNAILWSEILPGNHGEIINDVVKQQYDMIYGTWPTAANEVILVVNDRNEIDDICLYALGLESREYIDSVFKAAKDEGEVDTSTKKYSFEEICNMTFRVILNSDCYTYDAATGTYTDLRDNSTGLQYLYDNGFPIQVTGIVRPNADATGNSLKGSIAYTKLLTEYVVAHAKEAPAVKAQLEDPSRDVFSGLPFSENTGKLDAHERAEYFMQYVKERNDAEKASLYVKIKSIPDTAYLEQTVAQTMEQNGREQLMQQIIQGMSAQMSMDSKEVEEYLNAMSEEEQDEILRQAVEMQVKQQYAAAVAQELEAVPTEQKAALLSDYLENQEEAYLAECYDQVLEFSDRSYEDNLISLGVVDLEDPATINLYASSFENKEVIEDYIKQYNADRDELYRIQYTDYVGLMMSSITTIINAITYVLIAFVAISLIVSSIMIGVITLISVQERTKEIGILRAIGASKRNVSGMFNAETIMIGFGSGVFGVGFTYLLCIPINAVIHSLTGIHNLSARLPWNVALILIAISMFLTLLAGIIPSRSASKKDPVVALRTE